MGLGILVFGLVVFLGTHLFVSLRNARADVIARVGLLAYRGLFALVSLVGLVLIVWGYGQYRAHELVQVWSPPAFMRHVTVGLMLFAVIFIVAAFIPSHIKTRLKHPMLAGVKTWAFAHLLSNGDPAQSCSSARSWFGVSMPVSPPSGAAILGLRPRRLAAPMMHSWWGLVSWSTSRSAMRSIRP